MKKRVSVDLLIAVVVILSINMHAFGAEKKVIVGFRQAPGIEQRAKVERLHGRVDKEFEHVRAIAINIEESELAALESDPDVTYVEDDVRFLAIDPIVGGAATMASVAGNVEYDNAWSVSLIGATVAHTQPILGAGVSVAVLDTGIDYNHPDLDMNYSGGDNFVSLDPTNHDPMDDSYNSHGTHVAGVIAAELDGAGVVGVAPDASIYAIKVLDGAGFGSVSAIVAGINWAISNQMDIVNLSIGIPTYSQALADACAEAEAAGILIVAAAGNNYGGPVLYPAALPSVIAVGATTIFDEISILSPLGPEVELTAPGLNVYSTVAGGMYGYLGGTSQAAPHVTGLAALLLSADMPDVDGNGLVNSYDVRLLLRDSAVDLGDVGFDQSYGYGRVSVENAVQMLGSGGGQNPITELRIERHKGQHKKDWENITIEDGIYDVTIVNTDLKGIKIIVFENGRTRRDLMEKFIFHSCGDVPQAPNEVSFSIDATGHSFKLVFIPKGKKESMAVAYIQKQ